jgi:hypothetical protein
MQENVMSDRAVIRRHVGALLTEAKETGIPPDVVGRMLLDEVVELWRQHRSPEDIAAELRFTIENLDPDLDYPFIRP